MSENREAIISTVKEATAKLGKTLAVYGVPHHFLKDFVTSKADRKKGIMRIPEEGFRIKDEAGKSDSMKEILDQLPNFQKTKAHSIYQKNKSEKKVMLDEFKVIKMLGKGSFGQVPLYL